MRKSIWQSANKELFHISLILFINCCKSNSICGNTHLYKYLQLQIDNTKSVVLQWSLCILNHKNWQPEPIRFQQTVDHFLIVFIGHFPKETVPTIRHWENNRKSQNRTTMLKSMSFNCCIERNTNEISFKRLVIGFKVNKITKSNWNTTQASVNNEANDLSHYKSTVNIGWWHEPTEIFRKGKQM